MTQAKDLKTSVLIGLGIVALGVARHFHQFVLEQRTLERAAPFLTNTFLLWLHVVLVLCLMLTALGLAVRSRVGLSCSILGLLGVLVAHVGWYDYSRRTLKVFTDDPAFQKYPQLKPPSLFGLIGANWWDIVLLLLFLALLILEIRVLGKGVRRQRTEHF
jgi:hypothetical protein